MRKLCLAAWAVCLIPIAFGQHPVKARPKQKAASEKAFTLERILVCLRDVANKEYTEGALIKKVDRVGVDFVANSENLSRMKVAGASAAFVELVKRLRPPPSPPAQRAVKPDPTGTVEVSCVPVECIVSTGESAANSTVGGKLVLPGLSLGEHEIRVSKTGFVPWNSTVKFSSAERILVSAVLKPDLKTQQTWGAEIREKMLDAFGGEAGLRETQSMLAFGDVTIWGHDGRKYTSSIEMLTRLANKAFFRNRAGKRSLLEVEFLPNFRLKTNLQEDEARDLEAGLRLLFKYRIPAVMESLSATGVELLAQENQVRDGIELHSRRNTEELAIVLDKDGRPKEIRQELPMGPGIRALYSAYKMQGKGYIPTDVSIVWAGSPKQGIAVQLHSIVLNPDSKIDSQYQLKGGVRLPKLNN